MFIINKVKVMNQDTLISKLSQLEGLKGSLLVSKEGIVLAGSLSIDQNLAGTVMSSMFTNIDSQSKRMQRDNVKRFMIETDNESLVVSEVNLDGSNCLLYTEFPLEKNPDEINKTLDTLLAG